MRRRRVGFWVSWLLSASLLFTLGGCGSSSSTTPIVDPQDPNPQEVYSGIAVDPYIEGAIFDEIHGGEVLQTSSPSGPDGVFTFPNALTPGSTLIMVEGGVHNGVPFTGTLKRTVGSDTDAEGRFIASPLTTLLANGLTADEVIGLLTAAGIEGLTAADLLADPMAGLQGEVTDVLTNADLARLQAAMTVRAFLTVLDALDGDEADGWGASLEDIQAQSALLQSMAVAVKASLNADTVKAIAGFVADEFGIGAPPVRLTDVIQTAVTVTDYVTARVIAGDDPDTTGLMNSDLVGMLATYYYLANNFTAEQLEEFAEQTDAAMPQPGDTFVIDPTIAQDDLSAGGFEAAPPVFTRELIAGRTLVYFGREGMEIISIRADNTFFVAGWDDDGFFADEGSWQIVSGKLVPGGDEGGSAPLTLVSKSATEIVVEFEEDGFSRVETWQITVPFTAAELTDRSFFNFNGDENLIFRVGFAADGSGRAVEKILAQEQPGPAAAALQEGTSAEDFAWTIDNGVLVLTFGDVTDRIFRLPGRTVELKSMVVEPEILEVVGYSLDTQGGLTEVYRLELIPPAPLLAENLEDQLFRICPLSGCEEIPAEFDPESLPEITLVHVGADGRAALLEVDFTAWLEVATWQLDAAGEALVVTFDQAWEDGTERIAMRRLPDFIFGGVGEITFFVEQYDADGGILDAVVERWRMEVPFEEGIIGDSEFQVEDVDDQTGDPVFFVVRFDPEGAVLISEDGGGFVEEATWHIDRGLLFIDEDRTAGAERRNIVRLVEGGADSDLWVEFRHFRTADNEFYLDDLYVEFWERLSAVPQ